MNSNEREPTQDEMDVASVVMPLFKATLQEHGIQLAKFLGWSVLGDRNFYSISIEYRDVNGDARCITFMNGECYEHGLIDERRMFIRDMRSNTSLWDRPDGC
jgi:hypothetical protein